MGKYTQGILDRFTRSDELLAEMINIVTKQITRPNQQWGRWGYANRGALNYEIAKLHNTEEQTWN